MVETVGTPRPFVPVTPGTPDDPKTIEARSKIPKGVGEGGEGAPPVSPGQGGPSLGAPVPPPPRHGTTDPSSVSSTLSQFATNAPSIQQIAQIIQDANLRAREAARIDRQASRDAEQQALHSAADKIRDEANFNLGAAVVTSTLAIAGAAMTIGGALKAQSIRSDSIAEAEPLKAESDMLWTSAEAVGGEALEEPPPGAAGTTGGPPRPVAEIEAKLEEESSPPPPRQMSDDQFIDHLYEMIDEEPPSKAGQPPVDVSHLDLPEVAETSGPSAAKPPPPPAPEPEWDDEPPAPADHAASEPSGNPQEAKALRAAAARLDQKAAAIQSEAEGRAATVDKVWTGRGVVVTEMGKLAGAGLQRAGAEKAAEKAEEEAKASAARTKADDQTDFIRGYTDNIKAIQDKLSAMQQAEADTMRTILRA